MAQPSWNQIRSSRPVFVTVVFTHVGSPAGMGFRSSSMVTRTPSCSAVAVLFRSAGMLGTGELAGRGVVVGTEGGATGGRTDGEADPRIGGGLDGVGSATHPDIAMVSTEPT